MASSKESLSSSDWQALISEWSTSQESQSTFCKRKGLRYTSFCYWRSRLKLKKSKPSSGFKEASIISVSKPENDSHSSKEISLHIGDKIKVVCDISQLTQTLSSLTPFLD